MGDNLRVGTAEREAAIAELGDHFAAGRLEVDEYEQRCGIAANARTQAELRALFDDLPAKDVAVAVPADPLVRNDNPKSAKAMIVGFAAVALVGVVVVVAITSTWILLAPLLLVGAILFMMS
ncbi:DUF1707 SHOCT-like domain-containing protein [Actinokineospora sp. HUAS TT18]|uniref:DUF1707 SHOCT-like domain-containing protein n=1 Tax=Actinokineospora sp. HUAS TT18 TaxID=3447451 RepID=UPI003F520FA2